MSKDATVKAVRTSAPEDATAVSSEELPRAERRIARTAVEGDFCHARPELPEAVRSFADRFGAIDGAYPAYRGATYGLWIRVPDRVFATAGPSPEGDRSCGLL